MMQLGVNPKTLLISHNNIIEQIFDIIIDVLQSREVQFVLLDSLATLMSEKEFESDMDSNDMGRKAQAIGKGIKKVVGTISQITAQHGQSAAPTFIMTNQIRESTSMYGASEAVPGGKAPKFFSSQRVRLQVKHFLDEKGKEYSKTSNAEIEETLVAAKIYHKHVKNTFAPPQRSGNYSLYWDDRVFEHVEELVNLGLSTGIIEQANGSWYEFGEHRLNGAKNVLAHFRDNKTSFNKLVQQLNLPKLWDREVGHEGVDLKEIGYGYEGKPEEEEY
jgi:recombination protein RecA